MDLIKPKEIELTDIDGETHKFNISRFNALDGYELVSNFPKTMFNKGESFAQHREVIVKILAHCEKIDKEGNKIRLKTEGLINNHIPDFELLLKLLKEMGEYNTNFLQLFKKSNFIDQLKAKLPSIAQKILTQSLNASLKKS